VIPKQVSKGSSTRGKFLPYEKRATKPTRFLTCDVFQADTKGLALFVPGLLCLDIRPPPCLPFELALVAGLFGFS